MDQTHLLPYKKGGFSATDRQKSIEAMHTYARETGERALYDKQANVWHAFKFEDVKSMLHRKMGIAAAGKSTLGPLTPEWQLAMNPLIWPGFLYLRTIPAVTANADANKRLHRSVRKATFARPHGLSLHPAILRERWSKTIKHQVDTSMGNLALQGIFDFGRTFAQPIAAGVISEVIGDTEPLKTKKFANAQTDILGRLINNPLAQAGAVYALCGLERHMRRRIKDSRINPGKDLATLMVQQAQELGLRDKELAANLMNLMAAGYSTSYGTMVNSANFFSSPQGVVHLEAMEDLGEARQITDELTRRYSGLGAWKLNAEDSIPMGKKTIIPAGATVVVRLDAANQDPDVFANPAELDIARRKKGEPKHLAFGEGAHSCVGEQLAREEIAVAFHSLRKWRMNFRAVEEPVYPNDRLFNAPIRLLVRMV